MNLRGHPGFLAAALLLGAICFAGCRGDRKEPTPSGSTRTDPAQSTARARESTERAHELILKGNYERARPLLENALTFDPKYGPAVNDLGVIAYHTDRLHEAAWRFESAITLMPNQSEPRNNLGLVFEQAEKFADAEQHYNAASAMDLHNPIYAANRARVRVRQGKMDDLTRRLLDHLRLYDPRPEWRDWASDTLARFRLDELPPTTAPSTMPSP